MAENKPNIRERALFLISPTRGEKLFKERMMRESGKDKTGMPSMASSGYGKHGASQTLNSMIGWIVGGGSAEDDIDVHGSLLRKRSRDLYAGGGLARSGVATLKTNVVGWGIRPKPKIDGELLGLSDEACSEWERNTLREFNLWADNAMCDAERSKNFYTMQQLAFLSELVSGDCFVLFGMKENKRTPYQTTIRILEADRVMTPESSGESEAKATGGGGRIVDGIEFDKDGTVVRIHVTNRHPLMESSEEEIKCIPIDVIGKDTGYPNILQIMTYERPEQRRGIPFVSSQIEQIKQLDRYINSELAAQVVASMLTAFVTSQDDDGKFGLEDAVNENDKVSDDDLNLELAPGAIYSLPPGKNIQTVNPIRTNTGFEQFVSALETIIGASMEIPQEVLIKKYDSNYTAARSALLDFWKIVRVHRTAFNASFNQPIYEQWLSEAVAIGRIEAPGFFDDPAVRAAWCGCMWNGASMGHVDPLKEINAAEKRIDLNISTQEQEAAEYNGADWLANVRQRNKERAMSGDNAQNTRNNAQNTGENEQNGDDNNGEE